MTIQPYSQARRDQLEEQDSFTGICEDTDCGLESDNIRECDCGMMRICPNCRHVCEKCKEYIGCSQCMTWDENGDWVCVECITKSEN